jgi:hypothetical protein
MAEDQSYEIKNVIARLRNTCYAEKASMVPEDGHEKYLESQLSKLEGILGTEPLNRDQQVTVGTIFNNHIGKIPYEYHDIRQSYFNLALDYFESNDLEDNSRKSLLALEVMTGVSEIYHNLLSKPKVGKIQSNLPNSPVYHETAKQIAEFYERNKDDVEMLAGVTNVLEEAYLILMLGSHVEDRLPKGAKAIHELIGTADISTVKDPLIVKQIFDKVTEQYKK